MATDGSIPQPHVHPWNKKYWTIKRMMKKLAGDHEDPLDTSLTNIQYSRGLTNPTGENNCFVNSAVQVLWHMDMFRKNFKYVDGHACMGDACIFCALKVLFTQFQYSDKESLPPDALRKALAISFTKEKRFQLRSMDDAAECFENILLQIHFCLTNNMDDTQCTAKHCIPHTKFAMTVLSQSQCECGATSEPFLYKEFVRYISSVSLCTGIKNLENWRHSASFGEVLHNASIEKKECPSKCGKTAEVRCDLMNSPDVVTIGVIWDCDPSALHITDVIKGIKSSIKIKDMYSNVFEVDPDGGVFELVGLIAYYGKHYCTFFHHAHMNQWLYLEDTNVKSLGPSWQKVADICIRSRYQPSLLFYANPRWTLIDASDAPSETNLLPGYTITCKSPGADSRSGAAADYWPSKTIDHDGVKNAPVESSGNPSLRDDGIVEIGQAALGLVQEPTSGSSARDQDNKNNNRQQSPSRVSLGDANKETSSATRSDSGIGSINSSNRGSSCLASPKVARSKSHDQRVGFSPDTWQKLYDKQKQDKAEQEAESLKHPKLEVKPLDSFDMSVFRPELIEAVQPGAKSLFSLVNEDDCVTGDGHSGHGDECDSGSFELYHNDAFMDVSPDDPRVSSTSSKETSPVGSIGRTLGKADYRQSEVSKPPDPQSHIFQRTTKTAPDPYLDNSWVDLSPVMCAVKEQGPIPAKSNPVRIAERTSSEFDRNSQSEQKLGPVRISPNDPDYHQVDKDAPFWFGPKDNKTQQMGTSGRQGGSEARPLVVGPLGAQPLVMSRDGKSHGPVTSREGNFRTQQGDGQGVTRIPVVHSKDLSGRIEGQPSRGDRTNGRTGLDDRDDLAQLWREAKECLLASKEAEESGDTAVALGSIYQAAAKFKILLRKISKEDDHFRVIEQLYRKTNEKWRALELKKQEEDTQGPSIVYSRSVSLEKQDDVVSKKSERFLEDAVNDTRDSILHEDKGNHVPVTHWKDVTHTVRHVPIIVQGRHDNSSSHRNVNSTGGILPVRETPVRVYSSLPRTGAPRSRPFFVTTSTMRR